MTASVGPLRVVLDVNVWVANLIAADRGRNDTAVRQLVSMIARGEWGNSGRGVQLVISLDMLETLEAVLMRRNAQPQKIEAYSSAVMNIMKFGPEGLDPYLLLGGREQFAMADLEDAGVLATAFASRSDIVITGNLSDFETKDSTSIDTRIVGTSPNSRQLRAHRHRRGDVDLIVAHPFDVMDWIRQGYDFQPAKLWNEIKRIG